MPLRSDKSPRKTYEMRYKTMLEERESYLAHARDLSSWFQPRRGKFLVHDRAKGGKKNGKIRNAAGIRALRDLVSFMNQSITSPSRKWMRLILSNVELRELHDTRIWLRDTEDTLYEIFTRSNFYDSVAGFYLEKALFGTACMLIEEDFDSVARYKTLTFGQFCIAMDSQGKPTAMSRAYEMTVEQMVEAFGYEGATRVSDTVIEAYEKGHLHRTYEVRQIIERNDDRLQTGDAVPDSSFSWRSVYWSVDDPDRFLRVEGYRSQPFIAARWDAASEDVYGFCPTMDALPDVQELQKLTELISMAAEKEIHPPMWGGTGNQGDPASVLPGAVNYGRESVPGTPGLKPLYQIRPNLIPMLQRAAELIDSIRGHMYADMILALSAQRRSGTTAREVDEIHEEKMLALGGLSERARTEMLNPLMDRTLDIASRVQGPFGQTLIKPAPQEIIGEAIKFDYVSILAQAQMAVGVIGLERVVSFAALLTEITQNPEALDKIDVQQAMDEFSNMIGVSPRVIRSDKDAEALSQDRAAQAQAQQRAQGLAQAVDSAQTLSQTPINDGQSTGLDAVVQQIGAGAAQ